MGKAGVIYKEFRFRMEDELTEVYVLCYATGDCPIGVQGWHHKTFAASKSIMEIMDLMFRGDERDDPVLWPLSGPVTDLKDLIASR